MDYRLTKIYESMLRGESFSNQAPNSLLEMAKKVLPSPITDPTPAPATTPQAPVISGTGHYTNKSYNDTIIDLLGEIPEVAGNYTLGTTSNLTIHPVDKVILDQLYHTTDGSKGTGNGEIAIYWLFGKNYFVYDNRGQRDGEGNLTADAPDLRMSLTSGGNPTHGLVEIKSYNNLNEISLGKFKDDKSNRYLLSILLGVHVLFSATKLDFGKKDRPVTVDVFNPNEILTAFKDFKTLHNVFVVNKSLFDNFPANTFLSQMTDQLNHLTKKIIPGYETGPIKETEAELTNLLLKEFALSKLRKKPGMNGGCIINISKNAKRNIEIIQTNKNYNTSFDFSSNVASSSGELKIKNLLNLFQ